MGVICLFALAGVVVANEWSRYRQSQTELMMVEDYGRVLVAVDRERTGRGIALFAASESRKRLQALRWM
ncbi:MAG: hypothetical protein WA702_16345 [Bradyrhizobium sp.]|jgi:hypothetical protein